MYAEIIEKLHASNMKLFTYPSKIKVFTNLLKLSSGDVEVKRSFKHNDDIIANII